MKYFVPVFCLLILLWVSQNEAFGQQNNPTKPAVPPNPFQILTKGVRENNYLASVLELQRREDEYLAFPPMREVYFELLTQAYTYVGDYPAAAAAEEKLYENLDFRLKARVRNAQEIKQSPLEGFRARSALKTINEAGDKHQVIIINEEHRAPVHRALTYRLLSTLYAKGFRYFAAETLTIKDSDLSRRGYPTQESGFYTADPVYGDVIRQAIKLGFKIVHYEHETRCASDNSDVCQEERERGQAQNLYDRVLKQDPKAKILVHVGRTHAAKTNYEGHYALMAWHFQKITGIEPFTVDQVFYTELKNPLDELPLYRYAANKNLLLKEPTVFESPQGKFFTREGYDLQVFTPRVRYVNGRPDWLRLGGVRKAYRFDLKKLNLQSEQQKLKAPTPFLVQAFVVGESSDAIPIDQVILYPAKEIPVLLLPKGSFRIRAINEKGEIIGRYDIKKK
jgi:hypothetical protein